MNTSSKIICLIAIHILTAGLTSSKSLAQNFSGSYSGTATDSSPPRTFKTTLGQLSQRQGEVLFVTTTQNLEGYVVKEYLGVVRGVVVRQPTMGQNFAAGFQGMMSTNIDAYAQMCDQAREQSLQRLIQHAQALGANAIIGLRYDSSPISANPMETEVLSYGTAVIVSPLR